MKHLEEVRVGVYPLERFRSVLPRNEISEILAQAKRIRQRLSRRVVWNVNSTAVGGGVAEMLPSLLGYARSTGMDVRWLVIRGDPDFFRITKRIHHALHGSPGDGSPLDAGARRVYEEALRENAAELVELVRPGDVVLLHDPQTVGLAPALEDSKVHVLWRCHIGTDEPGPEVDLGWKFLRPYLECCRHFIFTRRVYVPKICDHGRSTIITPSIDVFSAKNQELDESSQRAILVSAGLVGGSAGEGNPGFHRDDGSPSRVERAADVVRSAKAPSFEVPLVVQVSRWDPLKDPVGVIAGFARLLETSRGRDAELVLAGPNVSGVTDDPEGPVTLEKVIAHWRRLPETVRDRIHVVCLPTEDVEENAAMVNALQRHATIIVQKSLHEGFGLTVTEAMWKGRPVVASAVGGIQDQIEDGTSGVLLRDPRDVGAFAVALDGLLSDPDRARRIGEAAHERVRKHFLGVGHLLKYGRLLEELGV